MNTIELIQPLTIKRDEHGWWSHPGIPDNGEDADAWEAWLAEQRLETEYALLESEADDHPAYVSYFENEEPSFAAWEPKAPDGEGWFTLSIHDTEDGPIWVWARRNHTKGE